MEEKDIVAMGKLKNSKVEVSINPKQYLFDYSKAELKKVEEVNREGLSEEDIKLLDLAKENLTKSIGKYENARLEAYFVPLKYSDLQTIKNGVLEAIEAGREYNWNESIKLRAMIREEHTLTVYLTLRRKDDITKRYYETLEEIAQETESTIEQLYNMYLINFVLTDDERKNS